MSDINSKKWDLNSDCNIPPNYRIAKAHTHSSTTTPNQIIFTTELETIDDI
jgi:hypothetical protein